MIHLGPVPRKMVKFNPGLSQVLSKVFSSKKVQLELTKYCCAFTPRCSNDNTKCYCKQYMGRQNTRTEQNFTPRLALIGLSGTQPRWLPLSIFWTTEAWNESVRTTNSGCCREMAFWRGSNVYFRHSTLRWYLQGLNWPLCMPMTCSVGWGFTATHPLNWDRSAILKT